MARIATVPRFAPANQAGRNSRAESRSVSPASCHRRSNSSPRHPGIWVAQPLLPELSFEAAVLLLLSGGNHRPASIFV
jgi:hypothetical protein